MRHLALMTTPAKRSALGTLSNTPGRPTGAPKSSQKRSSRSRRADLTEAPAKAPLRSAESMRRERGLGTWCNFIFGADAAAPGSTAVLSGSALSLHQVEQQVEEMLKLFQWNKSIYILLETSMQLHLLTIYCRR